MTNSCSSKVNCIHISTHCSCVLLQNAGAHCSALKLSSAVSIIWALQSVSLASACTSTLHVHCSENCLFAPIPMFHFSYLQCDLSHRCLTFSVKYVWSVRCSWSHLQDAWHPWNILQHAASIYSRTENVFHLYSDVNFICLRSESYHITHSSDLNHEGYYSKQQFNFMSYESNSLYEYSLIGSMKVNTIQLQLLLKLC